MRRQTRKLPGEREDLGNRLNDVIDVVDRIRNTSVFSYALVSEVNLTVSSYCNILQQSVTLDGSVDIGFAFFIQVDNLSIATTFVVNTPSSSHPCSSSPINRRSGQLTR